MSRSEAIEFFFRHGNVGRDVESLASAKPPTEGQLAAACQVAISRGQDPELVAVAKAAILG